MPNHLRYPLAERPLGYAKPNASEPTIPNDPAAPTNNPMMADTVSPHRERDTLGKSTAKGRVGRRWRTELEKAEELVGGKGGLTLKQRMFCREYLVQKGNATQAVIAAGYKANNANIEGSRLLGEPKIRAEIARLQALNAREVDISPARVLRRLDAISQAAEADGQYSAARGCEELIGKHIGMFIERSLNVSVSASSAHLEALLEVARRRSGSKDEPTLIEG